MYVSERSWRGPALFLASLLLIGVLAVPVCGSSTRARATARAIEAPPTKIKGLGINCHMELLPTSDLKAIGVKWVRLDRGNWKLDRAQIKERLDHYRDFGVLWILGKDDPVKEARMVADLGVADIEVLNEPKLNSVTVRDYAAIFAAVKDAVGNRTRLYGPSLSTWTAERFYLDSALREGIKPDVLSFHAYLQTSPSQIRDWIDQAKTYGLPVVVTEAGYPNYLGPTPYRARMTDSIADLFMKTKDAMGDTPWCWYDGPNPPGDYGTGLFDWDGAAYRKPNANYDAILRALRASRVSSRLNWRLWRNPWARYGAISMRSTPNWFGF